MKHYEYSENNKRQDVARFWQMAGKALTPPCGGECWDLEDGVFTYCDTCTDEKELNASIQPFTDSLWAKSRKGGN